MRTGAGARIRTGRLPSIVRKSAGAHEDTRRQMDHRHLLGIAIQKPNPLTWWVWLRSMHHPGTGRVVGRRAVGGEVLHLPWPPPAASDPQHAVLHHPHVSTEPHHEWVLPGDEHGSGAEAHAPWHWWD